MPPILAAKACSTMTRGRYRVESVMASAAMANGTKASSATSLVTSIEAKNGSMTSARHKERQAARFRRQRMGASGKQARSLKPFDGCHEAEQQRQHARVDGGEEIVARWNERARNEGA